METIVKICLSCKKQIEEENLHINYCVKCKAKNDKYNKIQKENNAQKSFKQAKEYIEEYTKENGKTLTPNGFSEKCPISATSIIRSIKGKTWVDILTMFGKGEQLKEYIKEEYLKFLDASDIISFYKFTKQHKYITYTFIKSSFNMRELLDYCGRKILRNETEDYRINFNTIKINLGYIPLHPDFMKLTNISVTSYMNKFGFKGKVYDNIVKMYSTDDEFKEYRNRQQINKIEVGKQTCNMGKTLLTLDDLELEFRKVFDKCFEETECYPSKRLFSKLSNHDDKTYREMLNMNWTDICKYYGYPTQYKKSIFENYVLKYMSKILDEEFESQKVYSWLIGINNSPLFCDGYFPKYNLIVEVDGRQHRQPYEKFGGEKSFKILQANDAIKNKLISEHEIKLLRIADNTNWHDVEYLKSRLEEVLGIELTSLLSAK